MIQMVDFTVFWTFKIVNCPTDEKWSCLKKKKKILNKSLNSYADGKICWAKRCMPLKSLPLTTHVSLLLLLLFFVG